MPRHIYILFSKSAKWLQQRSYQNVEPPAARLAHAAAAPPESGKHSNHYSDQ